MYLKSKWVQFPPCVIATFLWHSLTSQAVHTATLTMTNTFATMLTASEIRIAILELGSTYGEHDVLSVILRGMSISELRENLEYVIDEFNA